MLHQNNYDSPDELMFLMAESWISALRDCGASKTVCRQIWLDQFIQNLDKIDQDQIKFNNSSHIYQFGYGQKIRAIKSPQIPVIIGSKKFQIETDVIEGDIPLLLSKSSMKRGNMKINFQDDRIAILDENIPLMKTSSGYYTIPITKAKQIINNFKRGSTNSITLALSEVKDNYDVALKLHRQFVYPTQEKLLKLINNAGHPWSTNNELKEKIKEVSNTCTTCKIYKKTPPRPVVGLPMATRCQEVVAMDLKSYKGHTLLHFIDHFTCLSASSVIPNKKPETIIQSIFKIWISIYGSAEKFLSDNGGEFANKDFMDMCETLGITIKTTAAESPWSNGLVERHNLVLSEMLDKIIDETDCDISLAVSWCVNTKNSLHNVHGFSPYQLTLGMNPKLPSTLSEKFPAVTNKPVTKVTSQNLEALHKAREALIAAENSESIRRALSHNIRTICEVKYMTVDHVYFKHANSREWHGPANSTRLRWTASTSQKWWHLHPCPSMQTTTYLKM